jgi:hypothetical protein
MLIAIVHTLITVDPLNPTICVVLPAVTLITAELEHVNTRSHVVPFHTCGNTVAPLKPTFETPSTGVAVTPIPAAAPCIDTRKLPTVFVLHGFVVPFTYDGLAVVVAHIVKPPV